MKMARQSDVIKDFSDFKVNRFYGSKLLTVSDSVFLGYIKRAVKEEPIEKEDDVITKSEK